MQHKLQGVLQAVGGLGNDGDGVERFQLAGVVLQIQGRFLTLDNRRSIVRQAGNPVQKALSNRHFERVRQADHADGLLSGNHREAQEGFHIERTQSFIDLRSEFLGFGVHQHLPGARHLSRGGLIDRHFEYLANGALDADRAAENHHLARRVIFFNRHDGEARSGADFGGDCLVQAVDLLFGERNLGDAEQGQQLLVALFDLALGGFLVADIGENCGKLAFIRRKYFDVEMLIHFHVVRVK